MLSYWKLAVDLLPLGVKMTRQSASSTHDRLKLTLLLGLACLLSVGLYGVRVYYSGEPTYGFLLWNLFLAAIPFAISTLLFWKLPGSRLMFVGIAALWLLFFPNAPYVLTDLIHLWARPEVPLWFDLFLILSFACTSLMLGLVSLFDMQELVSRQFSRAAGWVFSLTSIVLGSFGIYLGRFLRWNSWDVLNNPTGLLQDILDRILNPLAHPRTIVFTLILSAFLLLAYLIMRQFSALRPKVQ
jgi:uncharacterized membrane protein